MLIANCANNSLSPVVVDTACSWGRFIYLNDYDIDVLENRTKSNILAYNKSVLANYPQPTEKAIK